MSHSILKALKTVCLENQEEKLYIANSHSISKHIIQLFMSDFYPSIHSDTDLQHKYYHSLKLTDEKKLVLKERQFERMIGINRLIKSYKKQQPRPEDMDDLNMTAQDIILNPFLYSPDYKDHFDE